MKGDMTKADVQAAFTGLLSEWRRRPEIRLVDEQQLSFSSFWGWLKDTYPQATRFRSVMGASADLEQWFDRATHQAWRN